MGSSCFLVFFCSRTAPCPESLGQPADAAIGTLSWNHALRDGATNFAFGDLEGIARLRGVSRLEGLSTLLDHRTHLGADMLIALSSTFGLTDTLKGRFMVGQFGLSSLVGGASYSGMPPASSPGGRRRSTAGVAATEHSRTWSFWRPRRTRVCVRCRRFKSRENQHAWRSRGNLSRARR